MVERGRLGRGQRALQRGQVRLADRERGRRAGPSLRRALRPRAPRRPGPHLLRLSSPAPRLAFQMQPIAPGGRLSCIRRQNAKKLPMARGAARGRNIRGPRGVFLSAGHNQLPLQTGEGFSYHMKNSFQQPKLLRQIVHRGFTAPTALPPKRHSSGTHAGRSLGTKGSRLSRPSAGSRPKATPGEGKRLVAL